MYYSLNFVQEDDLEDSDVAVAVASSDHKEVTQKDEGAYACHRYIIKNAKN